MSKRVDMIGKKFGLLTVKSMSEKRSGQGKRLLYICDCDCGKENVEVLGEHLRSGHTLSCGCLCREMASKTHKKINRYDISGNFGIGIASNTGNEFYFDLEDFNKIKNYCWRELKNGYMAAQIQNESGTVKSVYLHRFVMGANDGEIVDHKQHNKLDNRKRFLRVGSQSNNMMNRILRKDNSSGFTGVTMDKRTGKWIAEIIYNGEKKFLGTFKEKRDAVNARKNAEKDFFKDWSYQNSMKIKEV